MVVVTSRGAASGGSKVNNNKAATSTTAKLKAKEKDKIPTTAAKGSKTKEKEAVKKVKRKDSDNIVVDKLPGKSKKEDAASSLPTKAKAAKSKVSLELTNSQNKEKQKPPPTKNRSSPSIGLTKVGCNSSNNSSSNKTISVVPNQQPVANTKCIRTDNSMVTLSTNGPRIQAQRKFAQAGNIYTGTMLFNQSIPSNSPYATPSKETPLKRSQEGANGSSCSSSAKKVKKPMFSPPPCKRPKTEDFLTFLCVRGTSAVPPEFDFFKFPQVLESEAHVPPKKKIFPQAFCTQSSSTIELQTDVDVKNDNQLSQLSNKINKSNIVLKLKAQSKLHQARKIVKNTTKNSDLATKNSDTTAKKSLSSSSSTPAPVCKAENPTKGIRATASSVLFSKLRRTSPVTRARPILSPPRSRLNEQDARFAMTALKLKYQRLAVSKSNRSAILTKKAKESIILTRSRSQTSYSQGKLSPKKRKLLPRTHKPVIISPSRNAPSPDIIFGVTCSSAARKRAVKSSSEESESEEEEQVAKNNQSSEEEDDEEEAEGSANDDDSDPEPSGMEKKKSSTPPLLLTRSLRNGKELTRPKSKSPRPDKKQQPSNKMGSNKSSDNRRVGTRSAHRLTKSPLREIPMYKPKRLKRKLFKQNSKAEKKGTHNKNKMKDEKDKREIKDGKEKKDAKRASSPKKIVTRDDGKRPSRKTKETATNLLGLLTHGFSTDDEDSEIDRKRDTKNEDSEVGSSSSSEAHYLEKHYTAALRREEEKFSRNKNRKSGMQRRSSRRDSTNESAKFDNEMDNKTSERKLRSTRSTSDDVKSECGHLNKRIVSENKTKKDTPRTSTRTRRHGTPTVGDRKMPGAARKSASITCRGRSQYSSSENEEDSSSDHQSESEEVGNNSADNEENKKNVKQIANKSRRKKAIKDKLRRKMTKSSSSSKSVRGFKFRKSDYSDDEDEQSEENAKSNEEEEENQDEGKESENEVENSEDEDVDEVKGKSKVKKKKRSSPNLSNTRRRPQSSTQVKLKKEIKRERSSSMPRSEKSATPFEREESVETEQCKLSPRSRLSRSRSRSGSYDRSHSNLVEEAISSSDEEDEEEVEENAVEREMSSTSEDDEEEEESVPEKVDMSTQVDMDEEEGIARPLVSLAELAGLVPPQKQQPLPPPPPPPPSGSKSPNNDSDDDVQEIGIVFASSSTSTSSMPARHSSSRSPEKRSSNHSAPSLSAAGHSARTQGTPPCTSSSSPFLHHQHPTSPLLPPPLHQQPPQYHHHHHHTPTPPIIDPLLNNPFNPFMPPPPRSANIQQDFYTPLHLGPPLVQSFQLVGSTLGGMGGHFPVTNPLNTLSIPVTVPFSTHHLLPHHPSTMGFASGSTFHATTMQTHIQSVATNIGSNIPLVRPMVGSDHHSSSINFMSRGPSLGLSSNIPLTRPPVMGLGGVWGHHHQPQIDPSAASRNHYSAFRVPHLSSTTATHTTHTTQHVIHHQSTTVLGMNSTPVLPVSIIQPQTHQHHHPQQQPNQTNAQSQPGGSTTHYQQQYHQNTPNKSKVEKQNTSNSYASSTSTSAATSSSTSTSMPSQRPKSPTPPGYHLIKHLPNVSIVPKFDRDSHNAATSSSLSYKKQAKNGSNNEKDEPREKKKVGRKKKESAVLPHPSSPLTVRKDSNPSTYAPKKQNKSSIDKDSSSKEGKTLKSQSSSSSSSQHQCPPKQKIERDEGGKLGKKKEPSRHCLSPVPSSSGTSSTTAPITTSSNPKREKSESPKTNKTNKKHEKDVEASCSSSKSHHNSNPPSRTSSPNVQSKCKSSNKFTNDRVAKPQIDITDAPTFHPTDQEFEDPLKYIQKIQAEAEKYGMARIVPPKSFRPECNVEDDMRFTAYNHYIHKMYQRWGPNVLESEAIKHNLKQNKVDVSEIPVIGGMEINLSTMYQTVKSFGSLNEVIEKQRWTKVADTMHVPKAAHDRAAKLELIYLKYVLPYAILSDVEREKLKKKVEKKWTKRRETILKAAESCEDEDLDEDSMDELDECIVKGKTTPLSAYYRVARNTLNLFFPTEKEHSFDEIEEEYWKIVRDRNRPVCVYSGSIDCAGVGWGFPIPKASNKHPWNLKVLANNQGSVLRSMGPVMGATVPTLHVAMLFTSYCWYRDPHSLPWIEFLHSGANKIWYSVAAANENLFRSALTELMPMQCKKKQIWLASDSAMVPPEMLVAKGVPLVRMVQNPGEFLVVFPKAFTSAICTGYLISESVCFAYTSWLQTCIQTFKDIHDSKEPPVFPLEKLLLSILQDARASLEVVRSILPDTRQLIRDEIVLRKKISTLGVKFGGKISTDSESDSGNKNSSKKKKAAQEEEIEQCYNCNYTLYLSMVRNLKSDVAMCLKHAVEHFTKHKADIKKCNLLYDLEESQLNTILENASKRCGNVISLKSLEKS